MPEIEVPTQASHLFKNNITPSLKREVHPPIIKQIIKTKEGEYVFEDLVASDGDTILYYDGDKKIAELSHAGEITSLNTFTESVFTLKNPVNKKQLAIYSAGN